MPEHPACGVVYIVQRHRADLYGLLAREFADDAGVHLMWDRRSLERRRRTIAPAFERRRGPRRRRSDHDTQIRALGWTLIDLGA